MKAYSLLVGFGASFAVLRVVHQVPRWQAPKWANACLFTLLGGLLGARLFYVAFHWSYFATHLVEAAAFWLGGLHWLGMLTGAYLSILVLSARWGVAAGVIADRLSPMVPPLTISLLLGSWMLGIGYGGELPENLFFAVRSADEYGQIAPRFPAQFAAALFMLVFSIWFETRKWLVVGGGSKAALMGLGMAIAILAFTLLRVDPVPLLMGRRIDRYFAWALTAFHALLIVRQFYHAKREVVRG